MTRQEDVGAQEGAGALTPPAAGELRMLRDAVVDAAAVSAGLWFSYLLVLFYLLVGTAGVTQRDLLLSDIVTLPFLSGVQLPLRGFAALGPVIVVVSHTYVMLHLSLLASKVAAFDAALGRIDDPAVRARQRGDLPLNIFVQLFAGPDEVQRGPLAILLSLAVSVSLVIGPIGLLVFFVLQFLPLHEGVTWLQRLMVLADLVLLWLLRPAIVTLTRRGPPWRTAAARVALVLISLAAVQIVIVAATFRGEWLDTVLGDGAWRGPGWEREGLWSDHLMLDHAAMTGETRPGGGLVASLAGRDLERAVLTNTVMQQFDFTGASLRGAVLNYAQLQGSNLDGAHLEGASLAGVKLQGAALEGAILVGANLASAQLQAANLLGANLQGANLDHAQLQGATLEGAALDGAMLDGAQLQGASLLKTRLKGASLRKVFVWRADPAKADLAEARVGAPITDRRQACADQEGCPWPAPFDELKVQIARHVSADEIDTIAKRLEAQFLPVDRIDRDAALKERWTAVQAQSAQGEFERARALAWRTAGCAADGAPFVAVQLTQTLLAHRAQDGPDLAGLAGQLLQPACTGAEGLPETARTALKSLRDHPVPDRADEAGGD